MTQAVVEIVTFKTVEGADEAAFVQAAEAASVFLKSCRGFVRRSLTKGDDGTWIDHIEWRSLAEAKDAAALVLEQESLRPFMAAIDPDSAEMRHDPLLLQAD